MTGPAAPRTLTARQRETLLLAAAGHTGPQIARLLGVRSSSTVTYHLTRVYRALDAKDGMHAVALAIYHGHITLAELARIASKDAA
ncbi:helix-turn-helix transcriptional regulator [Streptomyces aureus]|uniref:helix-turn-helix domain-containing protein n=1 Tax=Streptomyces aureus TaxID=193461 RepID=UPI0036B4AFA6